jgi:hypothetical protein
MAPDEKSSFAFLLIELFLIELNCLHIFLFTKFILFGGLIEWITKAKANRLRIEIEKIMVYSN